MNITWLGVGKLGRPCAEVIAQKGHTVRGYDINRISSPHILQYTTIEGAVQIADIVFVAVPTPHDPDYDGRAPTAHGDKVHPGFFGDAEIAGCNAQPDHFVARLEVDGIRAARESLEIHEFHSECGRRLPDSRFELRVLHGYHATVEGRVSQRSASSVKDLFLNDRVQRGF